MRSSVPNTKFNMLSNFIGTGWSGLMGLIFVPFYINMMGVEAYGVVGIFVSLQALFSVLDLGLSQVLSREMTRLSGRQANNKRIIDTVRTLEVVYFLVAVVVVSAILLMSNYIAKYWLSPKDLSREQLQLALYVIALVIGFRWPVTLYIGGMNGLQKQVSLNVLVVIFSTFQGAGALAVLYLFGPTIQHFFYWQAFVALLQLIVMRYIFLSALPKGCASFSFDILKDSWRFALGLMGIAALSAVLTQLDKVILSRLLSLDEFGYYMFASTVAAIIFRFVGPVFTAYLPRLTKIVVSGDVRELAQVYHSSSQIMVLAMVPVSCSLVFFSSDLVRVWSGNIELSNNTGLLISILAFGNMLNGLVNIPYALQLAHAWTKLAFYQNLTAACILVPAIYFAAKTWGGVGAAAVWVFLNAMYILISVQIMHAKILRCEKKRWYLESLIIPVGFCFAIVWGGGELLPMPVDKYLAVLMIGCVGLVSLICVALSMPLTRTFLLQKMRSITSI